MVKFNLHNVTGNGAKARISYSLDNRIDGRKCVTLYAKDYSRNLGVIFGDAYKNDTDYQTDYFDAGKVVIFENNPLYTEARTAAESLLAKKRARWASKAA